MPVPSSRTDLSASAGSNSPGGTEVPFPSNLKNYLRALSAFIRQNYDDILALQTSTAALRPSGEITMWSGSVASIPSGWALCDGSNGTPNLRDRFVIGAGSTYSPAATGGSANPSAASNGAHTHSGVTGSHTLTSAEMPAHTHGISAGPYVTHGFVEGGGDAYSSLQTDTTDSTGGGGGHTHTIGSDGAHTHTVGLPLYYALCFIMRQ